jgi:hypothetical protein
MNADPDPVLKMNADPYGTDPDPNIREKKIFFCQSQQIMLNFNENKVTISNVIPITLIFKPYPTFYA